MKLISNKEITIKEDAESFKSGKKILNVGQSAKPCGGVNELILENLM